MDVPMDEGDDGDDGDKGDMGDKGEDLLAEDKYVLDSLGTDKGNKVKIEPTVNIDKGSNKIIVKSPPASLSLPPSSQDIRTLPLDQQEALANKVRLTKAKTRANPSPFKLAPHQRPQSPPRRPTPLHEGPPPRNGDWLCCRFYNKAKSTTCTKCGTTFDGNTHKRHMDNDDPRTICLYHTLYNHNMAQNPCKTPQLQLQTHHNCTITTH